MKKLKNIQIAQKNQHFNLIQSARFLWTFVINISFLDAAKSITRPANIAITIKGHLPMPFFSWWAKM
jgi:hypothetical protein